MSNTNGQVSFVKSMNGILSFNTGSGTIISGDTITTDNVICDTMILTNLNTDNIQGIAPADAITLYTNSTNTISLGNATVPTNIATLKFIGNEITSTNVITPFMIGGANMPSSQVIEIGRTQNVTYLGSAVALTDSTFVSTWEFYNNTLNMAGNTAAIVNICDRLTTGTLRDKINPLHIFCVLKKSG